MFIPNFSLCSSNHEQLRKINDPGFDLMKSMPLQHQLIRQRHNESLKTNECIRMFWKQETPFISTFSPVENSASFNYKLRNYKMKPSTITSQSNNRFEGTESSLNIDKVGESLLQCFRKEILATTIRYIFFIMLYLTLKICKVTILKIGMSGYRIRRPLNALIQEKVNLFGP